MISLQINAENTLFIYPQAKDAIDAAASQWIALAAQCIQEKGSFHVALSGGSTPKAIYALLASAYADAIDWKCVHLYWSDERNVASNHPESNYLMAMEAGFKNLPIPKNQIHSVPTHLDPFTCAQEYNKLLSHTQLGLVMLGMGADGHTASLFPHTEALKITDRYFTENLLLDGKTYRFTMTYPGIHLGKHCVIYALGNDKRERIRSVFLGKFDIEEQPVQGVGRKESPAHWTLDKAATGELIL